MIAIMGGLGSLLRVESAMQAVCKYRSVRSPRIWNYPHPAAADLELVHMLSVTAVRPVAPIGAQIYVLARFLRIGR